MSVFDQVDLTAAAETTANGATPSTPPAAPTPIRPSPASKHFTGLTVRIARSDDDLSDLYALRHRAYLERGAIRPKPSGQFIDRYDMTRTALQVIVSDGSSIVGGLRLAFQPPTRIGIADYPSSPEFEVFADVIAGLDHQSSPICSGSRLCIEPGHPRRVQIALLMMMAQVRGASAAGAGWGIATVRGSHVAFYRRILQMRPLSKERPMPGLTLSYQLVAADVPRVIGAVLDGMPGGCRDYFEAMHPDWDDQVRADLPAITLGEVA